MLFSLLVDGGLHPVWPHALTSHSSVNPLALSRPLHYLHIILNWLVLPYLLHIVSHAGHLSGGALYHSIYSFLLAFASFPHIVMFLYILSNTFKVLCLFYIVHNLFCALCMYRFMQFYLHTYIYAYVHTYIFIYVCLHKYGHQYIHIYIYTHIHAPSMFAYLHNIQ